MVKLNEVNEVKLNEYTKDEWRDVYFAFLPDSTEADYNAAWDEFVSMKQARERVVQ